MATEWGEVFVDLTFQNPKKPEYEISYYEEVDGVEVKGDFAGGEALKGSKLVKVKADLTRVLEFLAHKGFLWMQTNIYPNTGYVILNWDEVSKATHIGVPPNKMITRNEFIKKLEGLTPLTGVSVGTAIQIKCLSNPLLEGWKADSVNIAADTEKAMMQLNQAADWIDSQKKSILPQAPPPGKPTKKAQKPVKFDVEEPMAFSTTIGGDKVYVIAYYGKVRYEVTHNYLEDEKCLLPEDWPQVVRSKLYGAIGKPDPVDSPEWYSATPAIDFGHAAETDMQSARFNMSVKHPVTGYFGTLSSTVINLNDSHEWTREQIADWLDSLDEQPYFELKPEEPTEGETPKRIYKTTRVVEMQSA